MSKITQALEKAARERLQRKKTHPTVTTPVEPKRVAIESSRLGDIANAGEIVIDPHIVSATDSNSPIAEQYRILRTNIQQLGLKSSSKAMVVTSAVHGEGKSVTAINIAMTLARQENLRVVLVDADLRVGSIHKWLGLGKREHGLSEVLRSGGNLNGELVKLKEPPLTVLPAGSIPEHPAEMLESSSLKRLLATLKSQFDFIIIDAPPILPVADPGILAAQTDGVLFVVRAGKTQRKTVVQAQSLLKQMKVNVLGSVLTRVEYYLPGYYRYYHKYRYGAAPTNGKSNHSLKESAVLETSPTSN